MKESKKRIIISGIVFVLMAFIFWHIGLRPSEMLRNRPHWDNLAELTGFLACIALAWHMLAWHKND